MSIRYLVILVAGCATNPAPNGTCTYTEQQDKSNDLNTGNDTPPLGPEDSGLTLAASSVVICGAVNQGNYTTHDDNTADGDSYKFTVGAHTTGTLALSVTGDAPPIGTFRIQLLTPDDFAVTGYATVATAAPFDLQPNTYIIDVQAKHATGPLSQDYPYEISFEVTP